MVPAMGVTPGPVTVKLAAVMVVGSIASLKATATLLLVGTPVEPQVGARDVTVGAVVAVPTAVVKLHPKFAAIAVPVADLAVLVTVTVMRVLGGRGPVGVNCAVLLAAV